MPLAEKKYFYKTNMAWGLWRIDETLDTLTELFDLNAIDSSYLNKISHEKKKKEFLAGRLVLKELLTFFDHPYKGVFKDDISKPYLVDCPFHISLSNSHGYATAIIHPGQKTAIDIELASEKILRIAPKFLSETEQGFVNNDLFATTICWCAKETLYKIYPGRGLIFKENLHVLPFVVTGNTGTIHTILQTGSFRQEYKMVYYLKNGFAVTYIEYSTQNQYSSLG